ncbi:hypothetical protein [Streptomyces erythrochromogenes]
MALGRLSYDTVSHVHGPELVAAAATFAADLLGLTGAARTPAEDTA